MEGMGDMKDESDIRTAREREASQRRYPSKMDIPLCSCNLFVTSSPRSTQTRGEDTWTPLGFVPVWEASELIRAHFRPDRRKTRDETCEGEIRPCLLRGLSQPFTDSSSDSCDGSLRTM